MNRLKPVNGDELSYTRIIGTGGIGSGLFFRLEGNHTLGRNESRLGKLVPYKDYCKQHIILHYISVLLGAAPGGKFNVIPIGKIGDDSQAKQLLCEMKNAGMVIDNVLTVCDASTLFSVCFQYPDSTGGNITTSDSASGRVSPEDIDSFFGGFEKDTGKEIILAAPEVPISARIRLLETGRARGSFNAASVLSGEVDEFKLLGGLELVDLLAVNNDEARAIAGISDEAIDSRTIADACINILRTAITSMMIAITDGTLGCYFHSD
jgi:sugar/nucleoside kinase (ribokinase family)